MPKLTNLGNFDTSSLRGAGPQLREELESVLTEINTQIGLLKATQLPVVTVADNGKVAKVAGGVWTAGTDAT